MPVTDTSKDAYDQSTFTRETQAVRIWKLLKHRGWMTDPEIVSATGIRLSSVNGARNELMSRGLVEDSGQRAVNPVTGMLNILWRVT